jgi:hypothetical protein
VRYFYPDAHTDTNTDCDRDSFNDTKRFASMLVARQVSAN